ncbi:MAG TPA: hypothetical protein VJI33_02210 [Candidatus Paceibacterota bacterium]
MIKLINSIAFSGFFALISAFFLANIASAQVISPPALDKSGMQTIKLPTSAGVSGNGEAEVRSPTTNSLQLRSLEVAGLPTNLPNASITVAEDGVVKIKNAVVFQIAGSTFFARTYWGDSYIRWTMRTNNKTKIAKRFDGVANYSDLKVGHILNIDGELLSGADTLNIEASFIRDLSLENENASFKGKILKTDLGLANFTLQTDDGKILTVNTNGTTAIKKGLLSIQINNISTGDRILSVEGNYNQIKGVIVASSIEVYQDQSVFAPRNFQGTIKSLSGSVLPATFILVMKDREYNVVLAQNSPIMKANRSAADLKRFVDGDTIRVYGKIRDTDLNTIDAEVIRNMNL